LELWGLEKFLGATSKGEHFFDFQTLSLVEIIPFHLLNFVKDRRTASLSSKYDVKNLMKSITSEK